MYGHSLLVSRNIKLSIEGVVQCQTIEQSMVAHGALNDLWRGHTAKVLTPTLSLPVRGRHPAAFWKFSLSGA